MSFQLSPFYNNRTKRKEQDSQPMAHHFRIRTISPKLERASAFTSKGSITLEAAIVVPIFFFAVLCMVYLFEILAVQTSVRSALQSVGREVAQKAYPVPMISIRNIEEELVSILGEDQLEESIIVNGSEGLDCSQSKIDIRTACADLYVRYQVEIPVLLFRLPIRTYEERLRVKGWTGDKAAIDSALEYTMVYVTDYGIVYHDSLQCGYLELSIRGIAVSEVDSERNASGEKYYACGTCNEVMANGIVYITDYGNRYHTTLDCQGLKRNIYIVPLKDVNGLGGCSKCVD